MWFKGEVVQPRVAGLITVRYEDGTKIDQAEHEVRQWLDVRVLSRLVKAAKSGMQYLRNRLEGNLPPGQANYDCSHMYEVSKVATK